MNIPILRLELESMRFSILRAFTEMQIETDAMVNAAVERFCTKDNLQKIIDEQVASALKSSINEEIERFYRYGDGRTFIRDAISTAFKRDQEK